MTSNRTYLVTAIINFLLLLAAVTIPWYAMTVKIQGTTHTLLVWWAHIVISGPYANQVMSNCDEEFCLWWRDNGAGVDLIVLYAVCLLVSIITTILGVVMITAKSGSKSKKRNLLIVTLCLETAIMVAFAVAHPTAYGATYPGSKNIPNFIADKFIGNISDGDVDVSYFGPLGWWLSLSSTMFMVAMLFVVQSLDARDETAKVADEQEMVAAMHL